MEAETVYNVFQVLSESEKQRLLKMLSVPEKKAKKVIAKKPIITDGQAREIILKSAKKQRARCKKDKFTKPSKGDC